MNLYILEVLSITENFTCEWWSLNGQTHRENLPAITYIDGESYYYNFNEKIL